MSTAVISRARIKERQAAGERLSTASRRYLRCLARGDRDECSYCGCPLNDTNRTIDHKLSVLRGGSNKLENLCLACITCNHDKGIMTPDEYRQKLTKQRRTERKVTPSLGVRRPHKGVPLGAMLSNESQLALAQVVTEPAPCAACDLLRLIDRNALCPEHGVQF